MSNKNRNIVKISQVRKFTRILSWAYVIGCVVWLLIGAFCWAHPEEPVVPIPKKDPYFIIWFLPLIPGALYALVEIVVSKKINLGTKIALFFFVAFVLSFIILGSFFRYILKAVLESIIGTVILVAAWAIAEAYLAHIARKGRKNI